MRKRTKQLQRLLISLAAVLSLSASPVAACMCSHHESEQEVPKRSCHGPANPEHHQKAEIGNSSSFTETCVCVPSATKLSVKSEGFKLKKQHASPVDLSDPASIRFYAQTVATEFVPATVFRDTRAHRLRPPRGPPAS